MVEASVRIDDALNVHLDVKVREGESMSSDAVVEDTATPQHVEVEEPMAFKVGVVAGEDGGPPMLSIELEGKVIATFAQTEEGRQSFWNYMDTMRVADATVGDNLVKGVKDLSVSDD